MTHKVSGMRKMLASLFVIGLLFSLGACGDKKPTHTGAGGGSASGTTGGAKDGSTDDPGSNESTDEGAAATPTECVVGEWLVDNNELGAIFKNAGGEAGVSIKKPTGQVFVTFGSDNKISTTYKTWQMKFKGPDGTVGEMTREGTDTGTYKASDDGSMKVVDKSMNSKVSVKIAGSVQMTTPGQAQSFNATYECSGDVLKITSEGATSRLDRR